MKKLIEQKSEMPPTPLAVFFGELDARLCGLFSSINIFLAFFGYFEAMWGIKFVLGILFSAIAGFVAFLWLRESSPYASGGCVLFFGFVLQVIFFAMPWLWLIRR